MSERSLLLLFEAQTACVLTRGEDRGIDYAQLFVILPHADDAVDDEDDYRAHHNVPELR